MGGHRNGDVVEVVGTDGRHRTGGPQVQRVQESAVTGMSDHDGDLVAPRQADPVSVGIALDRDGDSSAAAQRATTDLLTIADPPTALFALNSPCAIGAARDLRAASRGHEVALIGFDDFEPADLLSPPLTVIAQSPREIGRRAAERLISRLDGDASPSQTITTPIRLIPRGSGEISAHRNGQH